MVVSPCFSVEPVHPPTKLYPSHSTPGSSSRGSLCCKVMIWDDHQSRCIGELSFRSEVKAVRLRRDRVVVVLAHRIYVYRFSDLHLLDRINTIRNDAGLVALCADASNMVLACPGVSRGHVNVELYDLRRSTLIPAHESELAQVKSLSFSLGVRDSIMTREEVVVIGTWIMDTRGLVHLIQPVCFFVQ